MHNCPMTSAQMRKALDDAQHRHEWAQEQAEEYRAARNAIVRQAIDADWTQSQIAEAMGITRGRVGQIANATREVLPEDA